MKADNAPILHPCTYGCTHFAPTLLKCTHGRTHDAPICTHGCTHGTHRINSYALRNEKYYSDVLFQTTYTTVFLTKSRVRNEGISLPSLRTYQLFSDIINTAIKYTKNHYEKREKNGIIRVWK